MYVCIRYAKIPDEPMSGMVAMKGTSSSASSSGEEDSSDSDDSGEERTQKLLALQQEVLSLRKVHCISCISLFNFNILY